MYLIYTTYFAIVHRLPIDVVPISIARWPPPGWKGQEFKRFAPSESILREYKARRNWARYCERYKSEILDQLDRVRTLELLDILSDGKVPALVCFERDPLTCHRSLVAEWLRESGKMVIEWYK